MKYFEQTEPFILVKARDNEQLEKIVADQISEDILEYPDNFDFHEVTEKYALNRFSHAKDEDGNPVRRGEVEADFYSDLEFVLAVGRQLI